MKLASLDKPEPILAVGLLWRKNNNYCLDLKPTTDHVSLTLAISRHFSIVGFNERVPTNPNFLSSSLLKIQHKVIKENRFSFLLLTFLFHSVLDVSSLENAVTQAAQNVSVACHDKLNSLRSETDRLTDALDAACTWLALSVDLFY